MGSDPSPGFGLTKKAPRDATAEGHTHHQNGLEMDMRTLPPGNPPAELAVQLNRVCDQLTDTLSTYPVGSEIRRLLSGAHLTLTGAHGVLSVTASMVNDQHEANAFEDRLTELLRTQS